MTQPDSVATLTADVRALTASIADLKDLFTTDQTRIAAQRRRDWKIAGALMALLAAGVVTQAVNLHSQHGNCSAVNASNTVLRDLFEPLRTSATAAPIPPDATPAQAQAIRAANARQAQQAKQFFADLEQRTAPRHC